MCLGIGKSEGYGRRLRGFYLMTLFSLQRRRNRLRVRVRGLVGEAGLKQEKERGQTRTS